MDENFNLTLFKFIFRPRKENNFGNHFTELLQP